ncbi:MAG: MBL fold metallo-hydrolase [Deltaproteobacteria bacterium]|nr:MAG: MBL fold metallo-hydrolase [Deltaproteobacteria bacterium]
MHITFYGATREVTGSMYLLATSTDRILLDCGMFQGRRKETAAKNKVIPFDPGILSNVVLSHAHIDHSGRLPVLTKNGFSGRIISTRSTAAACQYLIPDAAHIQESDAAYLNYKLVRSTLSEMEKSPKAKTISRRKLGEIKKLLKKNRHKLDLEKIDELIGKYGLEGIEPLYTVADAEEVLEYFDDYPYRYPVTVGKDTTCTLYDAGHILGSAMSLIKVRENGSVQTILHTGDIGRFSKPIIKDPCLDFAEEDRDVDLLLMESTYGNRDHEPVVDLKPGLERVMLEAFGRGGTLLIPAFAFGRTQTLLYILHQIYNENKLPRVPVYVDSPLAIRLTRVFGEHPEVYDETSHNDFLEKGMNPFHFDQLHFVSSVKESMALNRQDKPQIVIAASGMCEAGRILHHLRHKIHNPKNTILVVGYMAQNTLGRRIEEQGLAYQANGRKGDPPVLRFLNKDYPLRAHVVKTGGFSAHADRTEMLRFLKESNLRIKNIALVHGEEEQSFPFAEMLRGEGYSVFVPKRGETVRVK